MKIIRSLLRKHDNDIRTVAKKLDIGVSTVYRLLREERHT
jgi:transcriptional regulator with PAS, ATPase and Fis domain